ncbi:alpha-E domain-containing protein [Paraglaciecola aquimarina]|uniref:Alpha-E domain-containing protein n=1 Tax=Paraglaciecola aquimarina TaxID=1235557 RepID=A0ABU3SXI7_9ALTE|nr:alpha-E domain-containing protein [Paraglaciecola aquimarina]MDU0354692.1 alpha-E domain-containing protein [Paraglaciecola aquimarina]
MLSRVAETLYWMARHVERAENIARLVNVNNLLLMDLPKGISPGWEPLIHIIGSHENYLEHYADFSEKNVLTYMTIDKKNPSSLINALSAARENTRTVREIVPREIWEGINSLYLYVKDHNVELINKRHRFKHLRHVIDSTLMIFGTLDATINHDEGYTFIRFGSLLERADMTTRIMDVRSATMRDMPTDLPFENIQWISVLRSLSAYQMYRQQMGVRVRAEDILKFMLLSESFPRAITFCLNELNSLVSTLPNNTEILEHINHSIDDLHKQDINTLKGKVLHDYIDELQIDLADIHSELAKQYFLV